MIIEPIESSPRVWNAFEVELFEETDGRETVIALRAEDTVVAGDDTTVVTAEITVVPVCITGDETLVVRTPVEEEEEAAAALAFP